MNALTRSRYSSVVASYENSTSALLIQARAYPAHTGEPAVAVGRAPPLVLGHLRMGQDQEPLLGQGLDHGVGHLLRLDQGAGRERSRLRWQTVGHRSAH